MTTTKQKTLTPAELRYLVMHLTNSKFFDAKTMKFFGDTMRNYGVRDAGTHWELYRRHAVNGGLTASTYFDKVTYESTGAMSWAAQHIEAVQS